MTEYDLRLVPDDTDCPNVDNLSEEAEVFYRRLHLKSDDYGRFENNIQVLKSKLYPRKNYIRDTHISRCLDACRKAGLLHCYVDAQSRSVIELFNARQRKGKMKAKFLPPEGQMPLLIEQSGKHPPPQKNGREEKRRCAPHGTASACANGDCRHFAAALGEHPTSNIQHPTSNGETAGVESSVPGPTLAMVLECAQRIGVSAETARTLHAYHENNNCWHNQFNRLIHWQSKLKTWGEQDRGKKYENHGRNNGIGSDRNAGTFNAKTNTDGLKSKIR